MAMFTMVSKFLTWFRVPYLRKHLRFKIFIFFNFLFFYLNWIPNFQDIPVAISLVENECSTAKNILKVIHQEEVWKNKDRISFTSKYIFNEKLFSDRTKC